MQIPFFRNFSPGIHILYAFSLVFLGGMLGQGFMYLMQIVFWGSPELNFDYNSLTESDVTYWRMFNVVMPLFMFITPALVFCRLMEYTGQDYLVVRKKPRWKPVFIVVLLLILCSPVSNFLYYLNLQIDPEVIVGQSGEMIKAAEKENESINKVLFIVPEFSTYLINLLGVALLTAIGEELLFRSIVQRVFIKLMRNVHVAVIFGGLLFSLIHFSFSGFIPRFFMGLMLGYIYVCTANVWYCIVFHFLNNAIPLTAFWLQARGYDTESINSFGFYDHERWVALSILIIGLFFSFVYLNRLIKTDFVEDAREN